MSLSAEAIGYYRVLYDDRTLEADRLDFSNMPSGDRIALLADQWPLAQSGQQRLAGYLQFVSAMGTSRSDRAWSQVIDALSQLETYERGTPGYEGFTIYARSTLKATTTALGWDARADDTPPLLHPRRQLIRQLGEWGDADVMREVTQRFEHFLSDPTSLSPR